ncbi:diguanylate cyclase [Rhizobium sp. L80/93]|uniref:GGDEF domain-containing protein n=1 Tax=Rhizobium sp. E27B/91 TaxID=2819995 RepID=UPI001ADA4FEE|nr:GGDEF domain-containing protein [Rhizobium sp. E27B/91]MBO9186266.1 diguanylate cyclase [Rhizobium sp. E27B/91]
MQFQTIKKTVLAAILLPFAFMMAAGLLLIASSFEQYRTLEADRLIAEMLAHGGAIASTEIPAEMVATQAYLLDRNPDTAAAMRSTRDAVDSARRHFFARLPSADKFSGGINGQLSRLRFGYSRIVGLRSAIDDGRYGRQANVGYIYRQAALRQLGLGDSLSALIHDPLLLRKSNELMSILLTYHGELVVNNIGSHYLEQIGFSAMSREQLLQGDVTRRLGTDRLRFHTSSPVIRGIIDFLNQPGEKRADVYSQAILSGVLRPTPELRNLWAVAEEGRLAFLRQNILSVTQNLQDTGDELSRRAHYHLLAVVGLAIILSLLAAIVGGLAVKGMRLLDRLTREREELVTELRSASQTDLLTGLYNRRGFEAAAEALLGKDRARPVAVVLFDLDHFKKINDQHGHDVGDDVLRQVAAIAKRNFRGVDLLVRHGGEEFLALLPDTSKDEAASVAERVRRAVQDARIPLPDGGVVDVTASFGCAARTYSAHGDHFEDLIKKADMALYAAKASGRNYVATSGIVERRRRSPA